MFGRLRDKAGSAPARLPPGIHDLRHTFAVTTLLGWYRDGEDVAARLPWLSTYLGHREPRSTYWYLSAAPELLALAAERLDPMHRAGGAVMTPIAPTLQSFFTDRLVRQRQASPAHHRRLPRHHAAAAGVRARNGPARRPARLDWADLDAETITAFLDHLETDRGTTAPGPATLA